MPPQKRKRKAKEPSEARKKAKVKRLTKKDVQRVCTELRGIDVDEFRGDVIQQMDTEYHIQFFKERLQLWGYIKTANVAGLDSLLSTLLLNFVELYTKHSKGKDKYTKLLLSWYAYMQEYTAKDSEKGKVAWSELIVHWSDPDSIAESTKSCLMSSLLNGSLNEMMKRVECCLSNSPEHDATSWFPLAEGYKADDEVSLYRLAGFALFSCIRFRRRKLIWRRKLGVSKETAQRYRTEHAILQQLRDADKCDLPPAIHIQDRGGMTFIHPMLIPFVKNAVGEIRLLLNYEEYSKQGKEFFNVSTYNLFGALYAYTVYLMRILYPTACKEAPAYGKTAAPLSGIH